MKFGTGFDNRFCMGPPEQRRPVVLIVEDDFLLRIDAAEMIKAAGFEAIEAANADQAIQVLEARYDITVVFTDIQMPGSMDGLALAHHTARNWPKIALLITSARPRPDQERFPKKSRFLAKPYRHHHVIRHIRELAATA